MIKAKFVTIIDGVEQTLVEFEDYTLEAPSDSLPFFGAPQGEHSITIRGRGKIQ